MALVTIPQGLTNLLPSSTSFAVFATTMRLLEGIPTGIAEVCVSTLVIRLFPNKHEFVQAEGIYFGVRSLLAVASPAAGGVLYTAGGFTLPYTVIGFLAVPVAIFLRFAMGNEGSSGTVKESAAITPLLRIPAVVGIHLGLFVSMMTMFSTPKPVVL